MIDAYSRLVVGHAIADHLRTELVIDAFDVANWRRRTWDSRTQLANAMFEWTEVFSDRQRRHSTLGSKTPVDYDRTRPTAPAVAA